jgi:hypothetical protein
MRKEQEMKLPVRTSLMGRSERVAVMVAVALAMGLVPAV